MSLKLKPNKLMQRSVRAEVNKRRALIKHAANNSAMKEAAMKEAVKHRVRHACRR